MRRYTERTTNTCRTGQARHWPGTVELEALPRACAVRYPGDGFQVMLAGLRQAAALLSPGASITLPREVLLEALGQGETETMLRMNGEPPADTWRERLWTCPDETRLGVREIAEAVGRPPSWVYRAVSPHRYERAKDGTRRKVRRLEQPLPCERLDGKLVFRAGRVRSWIEARSGSHLRRPSGRVSLLTTNPEERT